MKIDVYLTFDGRCEEAFKFYQSILGGKIAMTMYWKDNPEGCDSDEFGGIPKGWEDKVMHSTLLMDNMSLMGSDNSPEHFEKPQGYHLSLTFNDEAEAKKVFDALSDGGNIIMPLAKTFWAKLFGMFTDQYGINWMINCD